MHLTFYRSTDNYWGQHLELNGRLVGLRGRHSGQTYGYIEISFRTDKPLGSSSFTTVISPAAFEALALEMVKADPGAAVKAFGAALQSVEFPKPEAKPTVPTHPTISANAPQTAATVTA
jgi:hypothetical protein